MGDKVEWSNPGWPNIPTTGVGGDMETLDNASFYGASDGDDTRVSQINELRDFAIDNRLNTIAGASVQQIATVGKSGQVQYNTIQAAIDAIVATGSPSANKRWLVLVAPGRYEENVTLPGWITLKGTGHRDETVIWKNTGNVLTLTGSPFHEMAVANLSIESTPTAPGARLVYCVSLIYGVAQNVAFRMMPNGTYATGIHIAAGSLEFSTVKGEYTQTGAGGGDHVMIEVGNLAGAVGIDGTLTMSVADASDDIFGYRSIASLSIPADVGITELSVTATAAGYSGNAYGLHHSGAADKIRFTGSQVTVEATGGGATGTGTAIYLNHGSARVRGIANTITVEGFSLNYLANLVQAGDTLISHYDKAQAAQNVTGAGTFTYVMTTESGDLQVSGQLYGGTESGVSLELNSTTNATKGDIKLNDPLNIYEDQTVLAGGVSDVFRYKPNATLTTPGGGVVHSVWELSADVNVSDSVFIYKMMNAAGTFNQQAPTTFAAFLFLYANPTCESTNPAYPPIGASVYNASVITKVNAGANVGNVNGVTGYHCAPKFEAVQAGDNMNVVNLFGLYFAPQFETKNAAAAFTVNNSVAVECQNPSVSFLGQQLGAENFTYYTGLNFQNITKPTYVYTIYSALTANANRYFLCHVGGAQSIHVGPIYFNEYIYHYNDADTFLQFRPDRITLNAGAVSMLDLVESTQDIVEVNPANADVDFHVEGDTGRVIDVDAAADSLGFYGVTPVAKASRATYSVSNWSPDRTYDASSTTLTEVANVLATVIDDLKTLGLFK